MQSNNDYFHSGTPHTSNAGNFNIPKFPEVVPTNNENAAQDHVYDLRSVDEIPERYRNVFVNYPYFNVIQSRILDVILYTDQSTVVSAPTGSGKTVIFELAILRLLMSLHSSEQMVPYKIVYVAPIKALCEERLVDWHCKFASFGLNCISVTGDSDNVDFQSLLNHNLIITTPEKWDYLTRRWRESKNVVALVKLFMIDEVHLLSENNRGPTLEAIVGRMKTIQDLVSAKDEDDNFLFSKKIRFVAVSATIPNAEDIAEWLSMPTAQAKAFKFGDDMRPVKLKKVVLGYSYNHQTSTPFKFDIMLNYKLESIMLQYAEGKPTLIFCSTRKNVEMTSKHITQNITINLHPQQREILRSAALLIKESKIGDMLVRGVCYHHAGLSFDDRKIIENLFRNANLPILVATSTLAMGVNLPAHLVIIKSTKHYFNGEYQDYSECMLLQMIGRAGRPQFDTSATAVILTTAPDKQKYENMVGGEQPVESSLHKHLVEHLNAEVVLQTITDLGVAMQWLTSTFLYIRARKHPRYYGLPLGLSLDQIDKKLLDMCQIEINRLAREGMLTIDHTNIIITPTNTGVLMAKYCVAFESMMLFTKVTGKEILQQILALISKCQEFSEIYLRVNDKKTLNLLNKCRGRETIRFPFNGTIKSVDMKINCIIQAVFGCLQILEQSLVTESQKIMRIGERISNCLSQYLETKSNCYAALLSALVLTKCFHTRLWENSPFVSKQLSGIGTALSAALVAAGLTTFKALLNVTPREIERIINRKSPMGNTMQEQIKHLPDYELLLEEVADEAQFSVNLKIHLRNAPHLQIQSSVNVNSTMTLLVGDTNNNIFLCEKYRHSYLIHNPEITRSFNFPISYEHEIRAHLISKDWVGIDCKATLLSSAAQKNAANKEAASANTSKADTSKKPSHIQTLVDTFFKKTKVNQKRKQQTLKPSPRKLENNKENVAATEPSGQTEHKGLQRQNPIKLDSNQLLNGRNTNDSEKLSQTQSQAVQQLIDNSLQECHKLQRNQPLATSSIITEKDSMGYTIPKDFIQNSQFKDSADPTVLVCSNDYSATVRRIPQPNLSLVDTSILKDTKNVGQSSKHEEIQAQFKSNIKISHFLPIKKKQFKLKENMNCTVNFEDSLRNTSSDNEENPNKSISLTVQYTPHKKYNHYSTTPAPTDCLQLNLSGALLPLLQNKSHLHTAADVDNRATKNFTSLPSKIKMEAPDTPETPKSSKNFPKTITWRSPLIMSPAIKYSPIFGNEVKQPDESINLSTTSSWNTPPVRDNKTNAAFGTNSNKSVEMSTGLSQTSSTFNSSQSSRPTLKQNLRKNIANIPLSDRDYNQTLSQGENLASEGLENNKPTEDELVSASLLESLGIIQQKSNRPLSQNIHSSSTVQVKKAKRPEHFPSVSEYYEQCESNFNGREVQYRHKQGIVGSSQMSKNNFKPFKNNLEVDNSNLTEQVDANGSSFSPMQQPSSSQNVDNAGNQTVFSSSFNDSSRDGSHLFESNKHTFNFKSNKHTFNTSLTQPSISPIAFNQENLPSRSLFNFRNEQNSFVVERPLQNNTYDLKLSPQRKKCFSQNLNSTQFNKMALQPCSGFLNMPQQHNTNPPRAKMQKHFSNYDIPNFTISTQPIKREPEQTCTTNCQCVHHFRNEVQNPPVADFNYYLQPNASQHYACHEHAAPRGYAGTPMTRCCPRMPSIQPSRLYKQPYHSSPQEFWKTANDSCNLDHSLYGSKRQKLDMLRQAPFASKRYSFHDCEPQANYVHGSTQGTRSMKYRHCSFHEDDPYKMYRPPSEDIYGGQHPYFMEFGRKHHVNKEFLLRRYLGSVDQNQLSDKNNSHSQRFMAYSPNILIEDIGSTSDDEFAED